VCSHCRSTWYTTLLFTPSLNYHSLPVVFSQNRISPPWTFLITPPFNKRHRNNRFHSCSICSQESHRARLRLARFFLRFVFPFLPWNSIFTPLYEIDFIVLCSGIYSSPNMQSIPDNIAQGSCPWTLQFSSSYSASSVVNIIPSSSYINFSIFVGSKSGNFSISIVTAAPFSFQDPGPRHQTTLTSGARLLRTSDLVSNPSFGT